MRKQAYFNHVWFLHLSCGRSGQCDSRWHTESGWPLFALGISCCSDKNFRNVPQSDPLAPAQLTCWVVIGSSGGQLSKNTAFAIYSPFAVAYNCHPLSATLWHRHGDSVQTYNPHCAITVKATWASLHNGSQSGRGGRGSLETAMTYRWEMLYLRQIPVFQPSYWSERSKCLVTLCLWCSATICDCIHSIVCMVQPNNN